MTPAKRTILEQGLAEAHTLGTLPDDADMVIFGVKEGDEIGGGIAVRINQRWKLAGEVTLNVDTRDWAGRVVVVAKSKAK